MPVPSAATMTPRRWEVLSAIASSFAQRGYHGIGMREIGQSIGLNQGTLYHHFASKDHALQAICIVGHERTLGILEEAMASRESFAERMTLLLDLHIQSLRELGNFLQVYILLREYVPDDLAEPLREGWRTYRHKIMSMVAQGVASGELRQDIDQRHAVWMLTSIFRTINQLHRSGRDGELEDFAVNAGDIFLRGVKAN